MVPMSALYVRIPVELHEQLKAQAQGERGYPRKGALQALVIKALQAAVAPVAKKTAKKGGK